MLNKAEKRVRNMGKGELFKKCVSAIIALIFLLNTCSPAWARDGNYGPKSAIHMFGSGAMAGAATAVACFFNPLAGAVGSATSDISGYIAYYYFYNSYGEKMKILGVELKLGHMEISKGQFWSMVIGTISASLAGFASGAGSGKSKGESGSGKEAPSISPDVTPITPDTTPTLSPASVGAAPGTAPASIVSAGPGIFSSLITAVVQLPLNIIKAVVNFFKDWWKTDLLETAWEKLWENLWGTAKMDGALKIFGKTIAKGAVTTATNLWQFIRHPIQFIKESSNNKLKELKARGNPTANPYYRYGKELRNGKEKELGKALAKAGVQLAEDLFTNTVKLLVSEYVKQNLEHGIYTKKGKKIIGPVDETIASMIGNMFATEVGAYVAAAVHQSVARAIGKRLDAQLGLLDKGEFDPAATVKVTSESGTQTVTQGQLMDCEDFIKDLAKDEIGKGKNKDKKYTMKVNGETVKFTADQIDAKTLKALKSFSQSTVSINTGSGQQEVPLSQLAGNNKLMKDIASGKKLGKDDKYKIGKNVDITGDQIDAGVVGAISSYKQGLSQTSEINTGSGKEEVSAIQFTGNYQLTQDINSGKKPGKDDNYEIDIGNGKKTTITGDQIDEKTITQLQAYNTGIAAMIAAGESGTRPVVEEGTIRISAGELAKLGVKIDEDGNLSSEKADKNGILTIKKADGTTESSNLKTARLKTTPLQIDQKGTSYSWEFPNKDEVKSSIDKARFSEQVVYMDKNQQPATQGLEAGPLLDSSASFELTATINRQRPLSVQEICNAGVRIVRIAADEKVVAKNANSEGELQVHRNDGTTTIVNINRLNSPDTKNLINTYNNSMATYFQVFGQYGALSMMANPDKSLRVRVTNIETREISKKEALNLGIEVDADGNLYVKKLDLVTSDGLAIGGFKKSTNPGYIELKIITNTQRYISFGELVNNKEIKAMAISGQKATEGGIYEVQGGGSVAISAKDLNQQVLPELKGYYVMQNSSSYRQLFTLTGGLPYNLNGKDMNTEGAFRAGYDAVRNMGLAPIVATATRIALLELLSGKGGYRTHYGDDRNRIFENLWKMTVAGAGANLVTDAFNNVDSLQEKIYGLNPGQNPFQTKGSLSYWFYMGRRALPETFQSLSQIAWGYYCKQRDIRPDAVDEQWMHFTFASVSSAAADVLFNQDRGLVKTSEKTGTDKQGNATYKTVYEKVKEEAYANPRISPRINWSDELATSTYRFLKGVKGSMAAEFVESALDSGLFPYPLRSPGTGPNAFMNQWNVQNGFIQYVDAMAQGASPIDAMLMPLASNLSYRADALVGESFSSAVYNHLLKNPDFHNSASFENDGILRSSITGSKTESIDLEKYPDLKRALEYKAKELKQDAADIEQGKKKGTEKEVARMKEDAADLEQGIKEGKYQRVVRTYRTSMAGVPKAQFTVGNALLADAVLAGLSKKVSEGKEANQLSFEEVKNNENLQFIYKAAVEPEFPEDKSLDNQGQVLEGTGNNIYSVAPLDEALSNAHSSERIFYTDNTADKAKRVNDLIEQFSSGVERYSPNPTLLDYTTVDQFGRLQNTYYYGTEYNNGQWQPVQLDKYTQHFYGPFGHQLSVTKDSTQSRASQSTQQLSAGWKSGLVEYWDKLAGDFSVAAGMEPIALAKQLGVEIAGNESPEELKSKFINYVESRLSSGETDIIEEIAGKVDTIAKDKSVGASEKIIGADFRNLIPTGKFVTQNGERKFVLDTNSDVFRRILPDAQQALLNGGSIVVDGKSVKALELSKDEGLKLVERLDETYKDKDGNIRTYGSDIEQLTNNTWKKSGRTQEETVYAILYANAMFAPQADGREWKDLSAKEKHNVLYGVTGWRLATAFLYEKDEVKQTLQKGFNNTNVIYLGSGADRIDLNQVQTIYVSGIVSPGKEIKAPSSVSKPEYETITTPQSNPNYLYDLSLYPTGAGYSPYAGPSYQVNAEEINSGPRLEAQKVNQLQGVRAFEYRRFTGRIASGISPFSDQTALPKWAVDTGYNPDGSLNFARVQNYYYDANKIADEIGAKVKKDTEEGDTASVSNLRKVELNNINGLTFVSGNGEDPNYYNAFYKVYTESYGENGPASKEEQDKLHKFEFAETEKRINPEKRIFTEIEERVNPLAGIEARINYNEAREIKRRLDVDSTTNTIIGADKVFLKSDFQDDRVSTTPVVDTEGYRNAVMESTLNKLKSEPLRKVTLKGIEQIRVAKPIPSSLIPMRQVEPTPSSEKTVISSEPGKSEPAYIETVSNPELEEQIVLTPNKHLLQQQKINNSLDLENAVRNATYKQEEKVQGFFIDSCKTGGITKDNYPRIMASLDDLEDIGGLSSEDLKYLETAKDNPDLLAARIESLAISTKLIPNELPKIPTLYVPIDSKKLAEPTPSSEKTVISSKSESLKKLTLKIEIPEIGLVNIKPAAQPLKPIKAAVPLVLVPKENIQLIPYQADNKITVTLTETGINNPAPEEIKPVVVQSSPETGTKPTQPLSKYDIKDYSQLKETVLNAAPNLDERYIGFLSECVNKYGTVTDENINQIIPPLAKAEENDAFGDWSPDGAMGYLMSSREDPVIPEDIKKSADQVREELNSGGFRNPSSRQETILSAESAAREEAIQRGDVVVTPALLSSGNFEMFLKKVTSPAFVNTIENEAGMVNFYNALQSLWNNNTLTRNNLIEVVDYLYKNPGEVDYASMRGELKGFNK